MSSKTYSIVDTDTGSLLSVSTDVHVPPAPGRIMTRLAFMRLLTDVEIGTIYAASKQNLQLEVWLDKFRLAEEINLDDPEIQAGLRALEAGGILAAGRADEVLG